MNNKIIEFNNVNFGYDSKLILDSANFAIEENDFVAIVGPNGGGKTTLLKLLLGILNPQSGEISVLGEDAISARNRIGYMPQYLQFDTEFPATSLEIVLMGRLNNKIFSFYSKKDKNIAMESLEKMGIAEVANKAFSDLSGGQRQRVLIARALATQPEILLLDEPTANIDPAIEHQFYELLKNLSKEMTIVTVSHDIGFVMNIVNKIICVNRKVHIHPASKFKGEFINEIYSSENYNMVNHDHCCSHQECEHLKR